MARRKDLIAGTIHSSKFVPDAQSQISLMEAFKSRSPAVRLRGRVTETVNYKDVPLLLKGWRSSVLSHFPRQFTSAELAKLESVLRQYVRGRVGRVEGIAWEELLSRLQSIVKKSGALLEELNKQSAAYTIAWSEISQVAKRRNMQTLTHDDVYPIVSGLHGASFHALQSAQQNRRSGRRGDHREPWINLISGLCQLFENAGGKATAAKNLRDGAYAEPSRFVKLVRTVMSEAIPQQLREYQTQSKGAMASEISRVLSLLRGKPRRNNGRKTSAPRSK